MRAVLLAPFTARTWREMGYALASLLFAAPAVLVPAALLVAAPAALTVVGLPLLVGVLLLARHLPGWFGFVARPLLGWDLSAPPPLSGRTAVARAREVLTDGRAWRAAVYAFAKAPLAAVTAYITLLGTVFGVLLLTSPLWWEAGIRDLGLPGVDSRPETGYAAAVGAVALLLCPWLLRGLVAVDRNLALLLLGPGPAERRIGELVTSRAALTADAATTLRRLERDLHDGTQARLVALGMTLSRIEKRLGPSDVDELVGEARAMVAEGLDELREIVRGIHPPALDAGLPTALGTLAARSGLPVSVLVDLDRPPAPAAATTLYFSAAELLSNAARHSGATAVRLSLTGADGWLRLAVSDDGRGGAAPSLSGTGLRGLVARAQALDGRVEVASPDGGPTTVTMSLPAA
ncbi:histidine kinase [Asanoa ishikariensis]|uniref:histidine kinase n=1 Tax=Asanoa ishikariensis TaxID=137265 RepID=A0A1H3TDM1_9ACTN|nr:sensor domain-containing protein [Asanoa ishikariensis]GIF62624.1 histidine kinase [Asanoa ishikariensis]SDZ48334.1 Histidine kinase [Asanoa ishikariensis]